MLSLLNKNWCQAEPPSVTVSQLERGLKIPKPVAVLLANRGVTSEESAREFLSSDLSRLHDPFLMADMRQAVDRVIKAMEQKEAITLFCDYDVDGVTSAAFLTHFFRDLNYPVEAYLPERKAEGYGLNSDAVRKIRAQGAGLMITADCGITGVKEVALANEIGLDVIVTDHHQVGGEGLPPAVAVLNPHRSDCEYPYRFLCGVGLAFKLAIAVRNELYSAGWSKEDLPNLKRHLDLFALGTIADVAPLTGENHILTQHGLKMLSITSKPGLVALKETAGIVGNVDARSVGFGLGPRLNAAGRLGRADNGLHLLASQNLKEAKALALELDQTNQERKEIQEETVAEAESLFKRHINLEEDRVIVLASEIFHPGVIGIAASRLVDKYRRPTVLIALEEGQGKGSGRSIPRFNLFKAFTDCSEHLVQFGGHAYAAGLSIAEEQVESFRNAMNEVGHKYLTDEDLIPEVKVDAVLNLEEITRPLYNQIALLEPFGAENPVPSFLSQGVQLQEIKFMGKEKNHVRFRAKQGKGKIEGVGFGLADIFSYIDPATDLFDVVYELDLNTWNGREKLQMKLLDIRHNTSTSG
ncbi:MAG: single-stranded-DNA-specific exonuclease RecJ [Nitrospinaceae bacterium]|nr:single-stranded-DNA-specific exonuclease RecJ [Nitrospina sp.]MBT5377303.1 single-stranded-DNA-specific exonuclease RecJ [Nitrospinaceae bacterium]MBT5868701.1 single-stranded-DNA-specific exonuclease RecJ [Nitrospinaceae bacterium]MBT6345270.1 single-stranded-DNA-specific exonuclease RecJ [Nitrospina sp.]